LLGLGLDSKAITRRVRDGRLHREYPGVYAVGRPATTPLEKASAAVLACGSTAALSHSSALTHWGVWKRWDQPFEVAVLHGNPRPKGITPHRSRSLKRYDTTVHYGIRVTKLARAVLDIAPRLTEDQLPRTVDNALHTPWMTHGHLVDQLLRNPRHPGAKRVRAYLTTGHGPSRSDWERAYPAFCRRYDLPEARLSRRVGRHTVDAIYEDEGLIVELDSWEFHSSKAAFEEDRDRDADNLALGLPTVRLTWERMFNEPDREAARLHAILATLRQRTAA
jgi:very-short-patch-repair endonuclease